eukprot:s886_g14.t1
MRLQREMTSHATAEPSTDSKSSASKPWDTPCTLDVFQVKRRRLGPEATAPAFSTALVLERPKEKPEPTLPELQIKASSDEELASQCSVVSAEAREEPKEPKEPSASGPPAPPWRRAMPQAAPATAATATQALHETLHAIAKALSEEQERRKAVESELASAKEQCAKLQEELSAMSKKLVDSEKRLQMQKAVSGLSHGASWQYEMDDGWEAFTREGNEKMHQAYLEFLGHIPGSQRVIINSGGVDRVVDFDLMQQEHVMTHKVRRIQVSAGVPREWITSVPDLLQQGNDLQSLYSEVTDNTIWDSIRYILQNTGHAWDQTKDCSCMRRAEVKSVHRIENMRLWHRYRTRLDGMRHDHAASNISVGSAELDLDGYANIMAQSQKTFDCGEALALDVDEKILLHGTSWNNANSIVQEGFDHRTCQNAFYGAGVYFACAACKSHQYTCEHFKGLMWQMASNCTCERTLIFARVLLGDSYIATATRKNDRRPPIRSGSSGTYDSIVVKPGRINGHHNQQQLHQEYVIFDRDQAYPCYVAHSKDSVVFGIEAFLRKIEFRPEAAYLSVLGKILLAPACAPSIPRVAEEVRRRLSFEVQPSTCPIWAAG